MSSIILAYVPVIHRGYIDFFRRHDKENIYLLNPDDFQEISYLSRDTRALSVQHIACMLHGLMQCGEIRTRPVVCNQVMHLARAWHGNIIMPDEDISREVAKLCVQAKSIEFESVFLRWNWGNVKKSNSVDADYAITEDEFFVRMMSLSIKLAHQSSDWWRQIGAVLFRDQDVLLLGYNKHVPSEHTPYIVGDPRTVFGPGESIEISSAHHAEKQVIARAARMGISTYGASLAVTTFPCPGCAMDIAEAGIDTVYFSEGYSLVAADEILRSKGVKIVRVHQTPDV